MERDAAAMRTQAQRMRMTDAMPKSENRNERRSHIATLIKLLTLRLVALGAGCRKIPITFTVLPQAWQKSITHVA